jgi:Ca2+-binding RTX toxin-like protein
MRLVIAAVALAAALAWIAAGQGHAAASDNAQLARNGVLTVTGTPGNDKIALRLAKNDPATIQIDFGDDNSPDFSFARADVKRIAVDARSGDDAVRIDEINGVFTDTIPTVLDGGPGNDSLAGGSGAELLLGGPGNDTIDGNRGNDASALGAGDDVFVWDPGDGSDTIAGQGGNDTMLFNGANASEEVNLAAVGNHLKFTRNVGNITMDTVGVEQVDFNALGGADLVTVNDLKAAGVKSVNVDLGSNGAGDGAADRVVVNGTNGNDQIAVTGDAGGVKVSGLFATVGISHAEAANDRLDVNTLSGTDTVDSHGLAVGAIQLFVNGLPV